MIFKKWLAVVLALVLAATACACGRNTVFDGSNDFV